MSRKVVGFIEGSGEFGNFTVGKRYLFDGDFITVDDNGEDVGFVSDSLAATLIRYGDKPIYAIDDALIERAREMEEALKGRVNPRDHLNFGECDHCKHTRPAGCALRSVCTFGPEDKWELKT